MDFSAVRSRLAGADGRFYWRSLGELADTPQFRDANHGAERAHWAATTGIGAPDDVAGPLLFLLSDAATMTGSTLTRERAYSHA